MKVEGVCVHTSEATHPYRTTIDKDDAQFALLAHLLFLQRAKSILAKWKSEWVSKANQQVHEWAPC